MDRTAHFYSQPSYAGAGGGFPVFTGSRRQRGGGIFGALARMVAPAITKVGKTALRSFGQNIAGLASDVAQSALRGEGIAGVKQTLRQQGLKRLKNVGSTALRTTMDSINNSLSKRATDAPTSGLKRPLSAASISSSPSPAAKRRRKKKQRRGGGSSAVANF